MSSQDCHQQGKGWWSPTWAPVSAADLPEMSKRPEPGPRRAGQNDIVKKSQKSLENKINKFKILSYFSWPMNDFWSSKDTRAAPGDQQGRVTSRRHGVYWASVCVTTAARARIEGQWHAVLV